MGLVHESALGGGKPQAFNKEAALPCCGLQRFRVETSGLQRYRRCAGFSIVEAMVGVGLLSIVMLGAMAYLAGAWRSVQLSQDRVFAAQKAVSILNEIRSFVETQQGGSATKLDDLDDGIYTNPVLTIADVPSPSHEASGNGVLRNGKWKYTRHITVRPLPNVAVRDIRLVLVQVYERNERGAEVLMADVGTVVHTVSDSFPTTQVYDVYVVALENVPGWWVYMSRIRPFMEATIADLQSRNPGLKFRTHWITKLSYGRDPQYTPIFNDGEVDSRQPVDYAYFYPGKMPPQQAGTISSDYYYVPYLVGARFWMKDSLANPPTLRNDYDRSDNVLTHNKWPYALADVYNHSMRYQDEWNYFQARYNDAVDKPDGTKDRKETSDCLTWRLLLDDMIAKPQRYANAIVVNLHGELLPMPPVRNYSDPAKDPGAYPYWRGVTHPENIWYFRSAVSPNNSESPRLRVYAYVTKPDDATLAAKMTVPISIAIKDADLTANVNGATNPTLTLQRIPGGVDAASGLLDTSVAYTEPQDAPGVPGGTTPHEMYYRVTYEQPSASNKYTLIKLYNTPLKCPLVGTGTTATGLASNRRLYGYEYIPSSCEPADNFAVTLATQGDGLEKNTARWIITIPRNNLGSAALPDQDQVLAVSTFIGEINQADVDGATKTCGVTYPPESRFKPHNISRTYIYWSNAPEYVPFTERFQFQGDPRHCPYADLKRPGVPYVRDTGAPILKPWSNGYNWYFDNMKNAATNAWDTGPTWKGNSTLYPARAPATTTRLSYHASRIKNDQGNDSDGWGGDMNDMDTPCYLFLLRTAMSECSALFTTLTGYSFFYMGLGGEIGYDAANGYANGIPVSAKPYDGSNGTGNEQWFTDSAGGTWGYGVKYVRENVAGSYWWGKPWLGELCPDHAYATQWAVNGNLLTGTGNGRFIRTIRSSITSNLPLGTTLVAARHRLSGEGSTSYFNIEPVAGQHFHHQFADAQSGNLTDTGGDMARTYFFPLPTNTKISRPFNLSLTGSTGNEWAYPENYPRFQAETVSEFYHHQNGSLGSALIAHSKDTNWNKMSFTVINGIDRTTETGSAFISRYTLLSLVHGYLTAGLSNKVGRVHQLPRVKIKEPTSTSQIDDPSSIPVRWSIQWRRWDGQKYTAGYPDAFGETDESDLRYILCYSPDNGTTWRFMKESSVVRVTVDDGLDEHPGYLPEPPDPAADAVRPDNVVGGDESFDWDVSDTARFPEGSYLVCVEAFRHSLPMHYAYHLEKIYIDR